MEGGGGSLTSLRPWWGRRSSADFLLGWPKSFGSFLATWGTLGRLGDLILMFNTHNMEKL